MHVTLSLYSHNCKKVWRACFPTTESMGLTGVTLANLDLLMRSPEFIEEHLEDTVAVQTEDIAAACYASKSALEKLFKYTIHFSVHDYIIRRKMTRAARLMIEKPARSILDIAVQFGYSSHEAFTRTFSQVWNCNPSDFKKRYTEKGREHSAELFPKITGFIKLEGEAIMRRTVDISELYDFFKSRKDCWFVCGDIVHLIPINEISHKAGDAAIAEALRRMESVCGPEDVVFRIGGDEFALLTNSREPAYAQELKEKILAMNEQSIQFEGKNIPLSLYAKTVKIEDKTVRYSEMFPKLMIPDTEKTNKK